MVVIALPPNTRLNGYTGVWLMKGPARELPTSSDGTTELTLLVTTENGWVIKFWVFFGVFAYYHLKRRIYLT